MATDTPRRQLPALTGVRFLLALWIVVYHQSSYLIESIGGPEEIRRAVTNVIHTGYAAVGVFFVLSGFVLTYNYDLSTLYRQPRLTRFAIARFARIYPAYLIALVLLMPIALYRFSASIDNGDLGPGDFFLNLSLTQAWVPTSALSWNYPGWSLSNEAFFYAVLPFVGLFFFRFIRPNSRRRAGPILFATAFVLWLLSMAMPVYTVVKEIPHFGNAPATDMELLGAGPWAGFVRYDPLIRLPEFCIGVVLAFFYRSRNAWPSLLGPWLYISGGVATIAVLANADHVPYPLIHNGLLVPAFAVIVLGLALGGGWLAKLFSTSTAVFLGNASYSMYILHVPIYTWLRLLFLRGLMMAPEGMTWFLTYVIVTIGASCLFYKLIEDPLHRRTRDWLNARVEPGVEARLPREPIASAKNLP